MLGLMKSGKSHKDMVRQRVWAKCSKLEAPEAPLNIQEQYTYEKLA